VHLRLRRDPPDVWLMLRAKGADTAFGT
jgi:hypothetical protein